VDAIYWKETNTGRSSNGKTAASGAAYRGSNPCLPAKVVHACSRNRRPYNLGVGPQQLILQTTIGDSKLGSLDHRTLNCTVWKRTHKPTTRS
jgi:hypothetical protein